VIFNPGTFEPVACAKRAAVQNDACSAEMVESVKKETAASRRMPPALLDCL
jgi:hypothetical protein